MRERAMPKLEVRAAVAGLSLSIVVAVVGSFLGFTPIGGLLGAAAGGYVAGRMAGRDGLLHGSVVGAMDVVALAIATNAASAATANVVVDTAATLVSDAVLLLFATAGGWIATRS